MDRNVIRIGECNKNRTRSPEPFRRLGAFYLALNFAHPAFWARLIRLRAGGRHSCGPSSPIALKLYNCAAMGTRVMFVFAVIVLAPIFVTAQNQPSGAQNRQKAQPANPVPPLSVNCNCVTQTDESKDKPHGWYKLVTWPEGIATWAVILTLGAIVWQSWETKKAAQAARDGVELQINKERARVRIIVNDPILSPNNAGVHWTLENYGTTYAFIHVALIRLVLTSEREIVSDYSKCKSVFIGKSIKPDTKLPLLALTQLEPSGLTANQIMEITKGTLFVHFYGFVKYQDLFDHRWRRRIHLRWGPHWELAGTPAENREISADPPTFPWWKFQWLKPAVENIKSAIENMKRAGQDPN
jgi:hypothetical protein